jgi:hypothetical protein
VLGARARERVHVLQPPGERVASALELLEAKQTRSDRRLQISATRRVDGDVRKVRRDRPRQLALEVRDLRAQRATRGTLVELLDGLSAAVGDQLLDLAHASDSS